MSEWLELYRTMVPANKLINDNHGQHYRTHEGCIDWLTEQWQALRDGKMSRMVGRGANRHQESVDIRSPFGFRMPTREEVAEWAGVHPIPDVERELTRDEMSGVLLDLRCEVWKTGSRTFDPQNYSKTFKAPLDLFVHAGYLPDDSWKYFNSVIYAGGGVDALGRAVVCENGSIPVSMTMVQWEEALVQNGLGHLEGAQIMAAMMIRMMIKRAT